MKHIMGNTPKCSECFWYREKEDYDKCRLDGWCTNKKQCAVGINGRKREHPPDREAVHWNGQCKWWEDAEDRVTHFEVQTMHPEPWKSEEEQAKVEKLLNDAVKKQKGARSERNGTVTKED